MTLIFSGSIIWMLLFSGILLFRVPYSVYLEIIVFPWKPIDAPTYPNLGVKAIEFVDSTHGWIGGKDGLIMATVDGGRSWYQQSSGINGSVQTIDFYSAQTGIVISKDGEIVVTQNGGINWTVLKKDKYFSSKFGRVEPGLRDAVICDEQTAWVLGSYGHFYHIDILHHNWTIVSHTTSSLFSLTMINTTHGWAVGMYGQIVRTQDGWHTSTLQDSRASSNFYCVFFWNILKGWVAGVNNLILGTSDGGHTWRTQYNYQHPILRGIESTCIFDIVFLTELKGWAVGSYGIHFTVDGGKSWSNLGSKSWGVSEIAFANETHGWAVGSVKQRSYYTTNGGILPLTEPLVNLGVGVSSFCGILVVFLILGKIVDSKVNRQWKNEFYEFL